MTVTHRPRLALARPAHHPMAELARTAGWEPVPFVFTALEATTEPLPRTPGPMTAIILLSPSGARVAAPHLEPGTVCLAQGAGTSAALGRTDLEVLLPEEARAESLWSLLQTRFPSGGDFILARGERSREYLEGAAQGSPWRIHPWVTHREVPLAPFPALPEVEGVLALSPFQAELLAPLAQGVARFAWGRSAAAAYAQAGAPAHATCEPDADALVAMLTRHLKKEESPC